MVQAMDRRHVYASNTTPRRSASSGSTPRRSGSTCTPRSGLTPRNVTRSVTPSSGSTPRSVTPRRKQVVPQTTKLQALVAEQCDKPPAPAHMSAFRNPDTSTGTRLGGVGSHPFGLSDWERRWPSRRVMSADELKARNVKGASIDGPSIQAHSRGAAGRAGVASEQQVTSGMMLRDAKRRRWHAEKTIEHMTHDMQLTGSETEQAKQVLLQYADALSVLGDGRARFLQVTMPMTGTSAKWRQFLKSDGVAHSIPLQSVPPSTHGNGNVLEHGAVATVKHPDGSFHRIRHFAPSSFENARFARSIPPGYAGFIPNEVQQLNALPRPARYKAPEREVADKPTRDLSSASRPPPPPPLAPRVREGWSAAQWVGSASAVSPLGLAARTVVRI